MERDQTVQSSTICATEYNYGLALIGLYKSGSQGEVLPELSVDFVLALSCML